MAKKNGQLQDPETPEAPADEPEARQRPVHEIRLGRVKCAIWANATEQGTRYAVTHGRLYKREDTGEWHTASNYQRDDLPPLIEALRLCWLHIYGMQQADGANPF